MRWLFRIVVYTALAGVFAAAILAALMLEPVPATTEQAPPTTEDVTAVRGLLGRFRAATQSTDPDATVTVSPREAAALFALAGRVVPGARGQASFEPGVVHVRGALPLGLVDGGPWVNVTASVPDFDGELAVSSLRVGSLDIPPELAKRSAVWATSLYLGDGAGRDFVAAFPQLRATPDEVRLAVAVGEEGRGSMAQKLFSVFRGDAMPSGSEVLAYHSELIQALEDGRLEPEGSFAPYLALMLERAWREGQGGDLGREYTAAVFALTSACGSDHIRDHLSKLLPEGEVLDQVEGRASPCGSAGLHGRVDLRRHFITAAALQAASNRGVAVSIGEFKELSDMGGASGFDFTDIVANNSGIRMSDRMMRTAHEEWPALLRLVGHEEDVIAPIEGIPTAMTRDQFAAGFGSLESPEYAAMLDRIEARIDALPLHLAGL